ncbi:TrmH family RNA methyltransferase [Patescibacteria group bacterium]|nr:TrmH family RNA methyltransferase [Patescibacteria group bacterium]
MISKSKKEIYLILPDIRSVYNVGAIFRTADACGVSKIYLTGYTPRPEDRFGRERKDVAKSALGAEKTVPWEYREKLEDLIDELKNKGIEIVAVEQDKNSIDYKNFEVTKATAFIFGNEVEGLSKNILTKMDRIIEIPMVGEKESLNVSVSAGIVLFRVLNV